MKNKHDFRLFLSLMVWTLVPSIYLLIRMNIISVSDININILGQMEWFDLIDEVIVTLLTLPLYSLLSKDNKSSSRNGVALVLSFGIYFLFTLIVALKVSKITEFMSASYATKYLFLQSISLLILYLSTFSILILTINDDYKTIHKLTLIKFILLVIFDYLLIPKFKDIGSSYSEIIVNLIVAIISLLIIYNKNLITFDFHNLNWIKEWAKIGTYSGIQIFFDNFFYAIMICKMVNSVAESGNYWVANNFIWGWLLVPVTCFAELIRKNKLESLTFNNTWKYGIIIALFWLITMPLWKWFISVPMASNANSILSIVYPSIKFYIISYIGSSFIDAWFISKGKTIYTAIISIIVNIGYYGIAYLMFNAGKFVRDMSFIIDLFGYGMVMHIILSIILYFIEQKTQIKL